MEEYTIKMKRYEDVVFDHDNRLIKIYTFTEMSIDMQEQANKHWRMKNRYKDYDLVFLLVERKSPNSKRFELEQRKTEALEEIADNIPKRVGEINPDTIYTITRKSPGEEHIEYVKGSRILNNISKQLSEEDVRRIVKEEILYSVKTDSLYPYILTKQ